MSFVPFSKPWCSHAELVQKLVGRGLIVTDPAAAEAFLAHVNYYRLSGYGVAFEPAGRRHAFEPGTTFEDLRAAYDFDFALRDLVGEALEVIEIDLRTTVAHGFGRQYGAFGHTNPAHFHRRPPARGNNPRPPFDHAGWLTKVRDETRRSKDRFVAHFRVTYSQTATHDLPIWALAEVMTFGCLSRMIAGMQPQDQRAVADRYRRQVTELVSWVHSLSIVRNVCAHHGRLWDRYWDVRPELPASHAWWPPHLDSNRRTPAMLLILYQMLRNIPAAADWAAAWQVRLRKRLADLPQAPVTAQLGFTDTWFANRLWG